MGSISSDLPECRGGSFLHIDVVLPHKSLQGFEKNIIKLFVGWEYVCKGFGVLEDKQFCSSYFEASLSCYSLD